MTNFSVTDVKDLLKETGDVLQKNGYSALALMFASKWLDEFYADYKQIGGTKIEYSSEKE